MREAVAVIALLILAMAIAWLRPLPDRTAPPPLPASACETWMADAIPGIGPKRRDQVCTGIRAGSIPADAAGWFTLEAAFE